MALPTDSFMDHRRAVIAEMHAERESVRTVAESDFTKCAIAAGLPESIEIIRANGKAERIRAQDVYKFWHKFAQDQQSVILNCTLAGVDAVLAAEFISWLAHHGTPRYRAAVMSAQREWLDAIGLLVVRRRLMEVKWRRDLFADPYARNLMSAAMLARHYIQEQAKLVHHIGKSYRDNQYVQRLFAELEERQSRFFNALLTAQKQNQPTPLPPLPPAARDLPLLPGVLGDEGDDGDEEHEATRWR